MFFKNIITYLISIIIIIIIIIMFTTSSFCSLLHRNILVCYIYNNFHLFITS